MNRITENAIEQTALEWLENLGYEIANGPDIAFDGQTPERDGSANYTDVVLIGRLRSALERINSTLPADAIDELAVDGELDHAVHADHVVDVPLPLALAAVFDGLAAAAARIVRRRLQAACSE